MSRWIDLGQALPWLRGERVHVVEAARRTELLAALARSGFDAHCMEGAPVRDAASFFREVSRALGFPPSFGHNWDALVDCLRDLEERPARRVAIVWADADIAAATDLQTFLDAVRAFEGAAAEVGAWRDDGGEPLQLEVFLLGAAPGFRSPQPAG